MPLLMNHEKRYFHAYVQKAAFTAVQHNFFYITCLHLCLFVIAWSMLPLRAHIDADS